MFGVSGQEMAQSREQFHCMAAVPSVESGSNVFDDHDSNLIGSSVRPEKAMQSSRVIIVALVVRNGG